MIIAGAARVLSVLGVAGLLAGVPGDAGRFGGPAALVSRLSAEALGITRVSDTEWRFSRLKMVQHPPQDFLKLIVLLEGFVTPLRDAQGRMAGYRMDRLALCPLFQEMGLQDGDVVRAINGEPLGSIYEMMLRFSRVSRATVSVERRGAPVTLVYWFD